MTQKNFKEFSYERAMAGKSSDIELKQVIQLMKKYSNNPDLIANSNLEILINKY